MATEIQHTKAVEGPVKNSKIDPSSKKIDPSSKKIDPSSKSGDVRMAGLKDGSVSDATSCISSVDATSSIRESEVDATSSIRESEVEHETVIADQGTYYPVNEMYGYYYPEWDGQSYYGADGLEIQHSANQADNGSVMYYIPGFQPDYTYSSFFPGATVNVDGQYLAQPLYYPTSASFQPFATPGLVYPQSVAYGTELMPAYSWDSYPLYANGVYGNIDAGSTYSTPKPNFSSQSRAHIPSKTFPSSKSGTAGKKGSSLTVDVSANQPTQDQQLKPSNKGSQPKGFLPVKKLPQYDTYPIQGKSGLLYPHNATIIKDSGRTWTGTEKLKARNKVQGYGEFDIQNEHNRGPRTTVVKSNLVSDPVGSEGNDNSGASDPVVRKEDYNLLDFPTKYNHALFFVIKSYSEDDIHKSIKYNVWASTPNGNKRLDNAFQLAQEKMVEKGSKCPVFLFFSVNASGQFCGVAEMIGRVDFCKTMDFWQQDKWTGYFPVKWHIIKDVPNPQFRHVILENNENKPVTNSRDTQEVKFIQGTEVLNIFKNYSSKTSILDDFGFYENRQKAMQQDRRIKDPTPNVELLSPKADVKAPVQGTDSIVPNAIVSGIQSITLATAEMKEELPIEDEVKE